MTVQKSIETLVHAALDLSMRDFFNTMLGVEIERGQPGALEQSIDPDSNFIAASLQWTGDLEGKVGIILEDSTACKIANVMIGLDTPSVDQIVLDTVGEMGNIVAGGAKTQMKHQRIAMSVPTVFQSDEAPTESASPVSNPESLVTVELTYDFLGMPILLTTSVVPAGALLHV